MKMSEEMAVRLHRMMWSDMQRELGDNPSAEARKEFKQEWITTHFPGEYIANNCFLCEYTKAPWAGSEECQECPIMWPGDTCCPLTTGEEVHYASSPVSKILELPDRRTGVRYITNNGKKAIAFDVASYFKFREELLSKASGIPASSAIDDHVKAIQEKAVQQSNLSKLYGDTKMELSKASGLPAAKGVNDHIKAIVKKASEDGYDTAKEYLAECSGVDQNELIFDHIRAIKEKAVEEYFEKQPAAKMVSMDVDEAFKQYADEQKAPIFHALAEASGLSASNESVKAHVSEISTKAKYSGRKEMAEEIFKTLSTYSGVTADTWCVYDHAMAIKRNASNEKDMEILIKTSMQLADKLDKYKDALSKESDLDRNRPVDDHIREIVKNSMEAGATEERDRIQSKIEELLS